MQQVNKQNSNILDLVKIVCCIFIIGSHCLPLFSSDRANYFYGQWFFRFCVPFFFITTGFFFQRMDETKKKYYIQRIATLYIVSTVIYLPLFYKTGIVGIFKNIVFGHRHLWYLSALSIGLVLVCLLNKVFKKQRYLLIILLAGGVLFDEYYKLTPYTLLQSLAECIDYIGGARHAIFFAVPMLLIGEWISESKIYNKLSFFYTMLLFLSLWFLSFGESVLLKNLLGMEITNDITIFGWMPAVPLLFYGLSTKCKLKMNTLRFLRKVTDLVYINHIWIRKIVDRVIGCDHIVRFILVVIMSYILAFAMEYILIGISKKYDIGTI